MLAWLRLLLASSRMVYRSRDTLLVGLIQPLVLIGLVALWRELRFETAAGSVDFFSFVATGFAAYGVVGVAQHSMVGAAADYRVQGVLKRVAVTPISPGAFISAQAVSRVGLAVLQVAATLGAAAALGAGIQLGPNLVWVMPLAALTALIGMSLAFVIAGVARTPDAANNLDLTLLMPIWFLAGIMFPTEGFPAVVEVFVDYAIPFKGLVEAIRGVSLDGASITHFGRQLAVASAWLLALLAVAARTYRLAEE